MFLDGLPAVLHNDFLGRFLRSFELVFAGIQDEIDDIPDLFALTPAPALAAAADKGALTLNLDSAAGLCPGDLLVLNPPDLADGADRDLTIPVEVVQIAGTGAPPPDQPTLVTVAAPTRFAHSRGTRAVVLRRSGRAEPARTVLARPVAPAARQQFAVIDAGALCVGPGDVVVVDEAELAEYVQVVTAEGAIFTVTPPFRHGHEAGRPVAMIAAAATFNPPPAFSFADRSGPQAVLTAPVLAGEAVLELDDAGIRVGDVLRLPDAEPSHVEFVQVTGLPPEQTSVVALKNGVTVSPPPRFDHQAGLELGVLGGESDGTVLTHSAVAGAIALAVEDPGVLGGAGSVLRIGGQYVQIMSIVNATVVVAPPVEGGHAAGEVVRPVAPAGGGTGFLAWLAAWIGFELRPARGERWNRELLRLTGRTLRWRGTRAGVEALLAAYLAGEAEQVTVRDPANPMQLGLVSTLGVDTFLCGGPPGFFWVDLVAEPGNSRLYHPLGLDAMVQAAHETLRHERPAQTYYDLQVSVHPMQLGTDPAREVGARVGDTTLLWDSPLISRGDR